MLGRIQFLISDYPEDGAAAASAFSPEMQHGVEMHDVPSLEAASEEAGFSPHLPAADVFSASPAYSIANVASATLPLRTSAIRSVVARPGGSASDVPETWNGVVLEVRAGPVIIADYNGTLLLRSLPFQLIKPVDFDLERFYRLAFRSLGMSEREAALLGADLGVSPAMLTFMPKEDRNLIHEFKTRTGTGMMIEEVYGSGKVPAVWSGADRVYALFGAVTSDFVTKVASALE